jgi:hypothetical protein
MPATYFHGTPSDTIAQVYFIGGLPSLAFVGDYMDHCGRCKKCYVSMFHGPYIGTLVDFRGSGFLVCFDLFA